MLANIWWASFIHYQSGLEFNSNNLQLFSSNYYFSFVSIRFCCWEYLDQRALLVLDKKCSEKLKIFSFSKMMWFRPIFYFKNENRNTRNKE